MKNRNTTYKNAFNREHYDRLGVMLLKGRKKEIEAHIDKTNDKSVNAFVNRAISETMERDGKK